MNDINNSTVAVFVILAAFQIVVHLGFTSDTAGSSKIPIMIAVLKNLNLSEGVVDGVNIIDITMPGYHNRLYPASGLCQDILDDNGNFLIQSQKILARTNSSVLS